GYMWIGTSDGVNKYNGTKFEVYKYSDNKENSISGNRVSDIKEDLEGNIWIGTRTGLNKIDSKTNNITRYLPGENGCNISNYRIRDILVTSKGDIYVATDDGVNKYDKENDNFILMYNSDDLESSLSNQEVYSLAEDIYGGIWVGTKHGLNKIDLTSQKIIKYFADEEDEMSIGHNFIYSLHADDTGNLWIGTYYGGLNKLDLKTGKVKKLMPGDEESIGGAYVREVLKDSRGYVWVATDYGFNKYDEEEDKFITYKSSKYNEGSIISDNALSICEDQSGAIWIGTDEGISLFNPENLFNYYKSDPFNDNSLSSDSISGIYEDEDGLLWVGTTYDGLNIIDRKSNKVTRIDHTKDYDGELTISNNLVREITGIGNEVWIATENGLDKYDKNTGEITKYKQGMGLILNDVRNLHIDEEGVLWIGTRVGLCSFDRKGTFIDYRDIFSENGIEDQNITEIYEDDDGVIWLSMGVENGLVSLDKKTNEVKIYNDFYGNEEGVERKYNYIISIECDEEGNLWLGTDYGLVKFNKKTKEYTRYTEENGLANNFIYGVLIEDNNNLWVSTNYGISKFDIKEEKFINFDSTDGIQGNEFNQYAYYKSKNGEIFFGGINGLTSFFPNDIVEKNFISKVQIESISTNNGKLYLEDKIKLDYKNTQLQFDFFMPDYRNVKKLSYAYKLNGIDENWIMSENKNSANYTNLKSGNYVFQVAARNSSGEWSSPTSIEVIIGSPPWKTPLAYVLYVISFIFVIYVIWNRVKILDNMVKQRTAELNNKLKENEQLYSKLLHHEKYKNNYFINLSHELRTPLNIISSTQNLIESLNRENKKISQDKMSHYMGTIKGNCRRLVNLIDNIIYTSKIEYGQYKLNKKSCDIVYLVEEIALSMKDFIEENGLTLVIEPDIEEKIIECDELEIERVIINLISNAIKFTKEGGLIEVYIFDLGNEVKIVVKDSGIGIDKKHHETIFNRFSQAYSDTSEEYGGSGLGLTLSRQLIELHGGSICVESEIGKGSTFIVKLPVKKEDNN
ncbi:ligand-binding sensor domain-containing protein, partial [Clostridium sp.]|uniref:ligand-binding sensor domain-containing protein n=1 Tax=Clostridium sp. TaxID=1506 RepID=UPI003F3CCDE9